MPDVSRLRDLAISDTGFVFDPMTGYTYSVNDTALMIVRLLKAGEPVTAIVDRLSGGFAVEPEEDVARDVDEFVSALREQGLIR